MEHRSRWLFAQPVSHGWTQSSDGRQHGAALARTSALFPICLLLEISNSGLGGLFHSIIWVEHVCSAFGPVLPAVLGAQILFFLSRSS